MTEEITRSPLQEAVERFGSEEALAHELRLRRDTIDNWVRARCVPKDKARAVALLMQDEDLEERLHAW